MLRQLWRTALAIGGMLVLVSCGTDAGGDEIISSDVPEATTSSTSIVTTTSIPVVVASVPVTSEPPPTTTEPLEDERIAVLRQFIDSYADVDLDGLKSTIDPEYLSSIGFAAPLSTEGWWTWMIQYDWDGAIIGCRAAGERVICEDRGTDQFSRALDYEAAINWSAVVENGLITDLQMNPSDGGVWGANFAWMQEAYPDKLACTENSAIPTPDPWLGVPSDEWIKHCVEFQILKAPEFGESDRYVPPAELD